MAARYGLNDAQLSAAAQLHGGMNAWRRMSQAQQATLVAGGPNHNLVLGPPLQAPAAGAGASGSAGAGASGSAGAGASGSAGAGSSGSAGAGASGSVPGSAGAGASGSAGAGASGSAPGGGPLGSSGSAGAGASGSTPGGSDRIHLSRNSRKRPIDV
jgi:hypothetical protein